MKNKTKRVFGFSALALVLAVALVIGLLPGQVFAAGRKASDVSTETKFHLSLGDDASTEYAGRIWTDKSVWAGNAEIQLKTGSSQTVVNDSDFLVGFSALATSMAVSGSTKAPVDVVFVIDTSGSMDDDMSSTDSTNRIVNTVNALNDAIEEVMNLNEYTRVGVVAFSSTSQVLLELGRYEKGSRTYGQGFGQNTVTDYFSLSGNTLYKHVIPEGSTRQSTGTRSITGGTNIQRGLYTGLNMLATEESTHANINGSLIQRVPSLVLLSDGAPTFSSDSTAWWAPENNDDDGDGSSAYYGNGMKALMTGAYMKAAVDRNYGVTDTQMATTVYTIGMGITGLSNYSYYGGFRYYTGEQDLAYMTLNPGAYWTADNDMAESIVDAWNTYSSNDGVPNVSVGGGNYSFTHPAQYDIDTDPDALKGFVDSYYSADSASSVTNVFEQIVANIAISAPEVPTEMKHTDALNTGFIHYTDPLGKYTEMKSLKGIIYDGVYYPSADGRTVSAEVETELFGKQNLSDIRITVSGTAGVDQAVEIDVPAALIPLRINTVELNEDGSVKSHVNNGSFPIRVIYSVGLVDEVVIGSGDDRIVNTEKISADYLAANTNEDGSINFYSNLFTGKTTNEDFHDHTVGDATVEFEPSHTNPFYYMQGDVPIYKDTAGTQPVTSAEGLQDDVIYYVVSDYYHGTSVEQEIFGRTGAQLKKSEIITGADGNLYRAAGSPRLNRILEFAGHKDEPLPGTADDFYFPTFVHDPQDPDPAAGKYVIYLGNNGVLALPGTGALEITKNVEIPAGLTPDVDSFEFTVNFNGSATLAGDFPYTVIGTSTVGTVADGGTLTLKAGQTVRITGLPSGTTYTVTEKDYSAQGFATVKTGDNGTVLAGQTAEAVFTNRYSVTPVSYPPTGDGGFKGKKVLEGRAWINGTDEYSFVIVPYNNAPLPAGYDAVNGVTVTTGTRVDDNTYEAGFDFGKITFTEPGVYRYTVGEVEPLAEEFLPGMTYSRALYRVVITVVDDGEGKLTATTDIQKLYTDDASPLFSYDASNQIVMNPGQEAQDAIVFINHYEAGSVTSTPVAVKHYVDLSGATKLVSGMFNFRLEALGYCVGDYSSSTFVADNTIPMPDGSVGGVITSTNEGTNVTFPSVTFTQADLRGNTKLTYRYKITEVAGSTGAMTYDSAVYYANVTVSVDGGAVLSVSVKYLTEGGAEVRVPEFTNTYDPDDATLTQSAGTAIHGNKTLTGRPFGAVDEFKFTLTAVNDAAKSVLPAAETVTLAPSAVGQYTSPFTFGDMTFTKVGVYTFTVTEVQGSKGGITYDSNVTAVTVTVTHDAVADKLVAAVSYDNAAEGYADTEAEFRNTYTADFAGETVTLTGSKTLTGKELVDGEFYFNVLEQDALGNKLREFLVTHKTDSDKDGVAEIVYLNNLSYDKAGTYVYILSEQIPVTPVGGTDYDLSKFRFTVVVTDDGLGKLSVTSKTLEKMAEGDADYSAFGGTTVDFVNRYTPNPLTVTFPVIHKVLSGDLRKDPLQADEFSFKLSLVSATPADGILLPAVTVVKNAADGSILFDPVTFTKAGYYSIKIEELLPVGAVDEDPAKEGFQINGVTYASSAITATIHVTDDRNGNLSVAVASNQGGREIVNVYETEGSGKLTVEKILQGRPWNATDSFEFEIVIEDPATLEAVNNGDIVFPHDGNDILKLVANSTQQTVQSPDLMFYKPGTYKFLVHEINGGIPGILYDEARHEVIVTCTDNGDGTMNVTTNYPANTLVFTNVYDDASAEIDGHTKLNVNKIFTGRPGNAWLDSDHFVFTLSAADAYTQNAVAQGYVELPANAGGLVVTSDNLNHVHFGNIIFHEANASTELYRFVVKEISSPSALSAIDPSYFAIPGVSYDNDSDRNFAVRVTSNGAGLLIAEVVAAETEELSFHNTYSTEEVTLDTNLALMITKKLIGRNWFTTDSFSFSLEPVNGTVDAVNGGVVVISDSAKNLTITSANTNYQGSFGDPSDPDDGITFYQAGNYSFRIKELAGTDPKITYDTHELLVNVTVVDNTQGGLMVEDVSFLGSSTFENTYTPSSTTAVLEGIKTLNGNRTLADGEFSFRIEPLNGAPAPARLEVTNVGSSVSFGAISYGAEGVYKYLITEVEGSIPGVRYDRGSVEATVTVTYDASLGEFVAVASYEKKTTAGNGFEFVNNYSADATDPIKLEAVKKVTPVIGNSFTLEAGDFNFAIKPAQSNPQPDPVASATVANDEQGKVVFAQNVFYTQTGTWVYTINEINAQSAGILYDESVYTVTVTVTENVSAGKLEAQVTVKKGNTTVAEGLNGILFDNGYNPEKTSAIISGEKVLHGDHKTLEAGEFSFKLEAKNGAPLPQNTLVTNEQTGIFTFGEIEYTVPGVYEYTVTEVDAGKTGYTYDGSSFDVKVTVTDDNGMLKASVEGVSDAQGKALIVFNNSYAPVAVAVDINGTKKIVDADGKESFRKVRENEFTFVLLDRLGNELATAKSKADGSFTFEDVAFDKAGTYSLTVIEKTSLVPGITDDLSVLAVDVEVSDDNGVLKAAVTYPQDGLVFKNVYKAGGTSIRLEASKEITGRELADGEFSFELMDENGVVLSVGKNAKDGSIFFEEIDYTEAGTYRYTIREILGNVEHVTYDNTVYTVVVKVTDEGDGVLKAELEDKTPVVFHNTYEAPVPPSSSTVPPTSSTPPTSTEPPAPPTGDKSSFGLWILTVALSVALVATPVVIGKKRR